MPPLTADDEFEPPRCKGRLARWAVPGVIAALAMLALLSRIDGLTESLWVDELHTAWTVSSGATEIPSRAAMGNSSPLYFLAPWLATRLFGAHEWSLRLPSLLAGVALVPALYVALVRMKCSPAAGLLAAALAATDPVFVAFAREARAYALVQLVAVVHVLVFLDLLKQPTRAGRVAYVLLGAVLFYLHYTAALVLAAEAALYFAWKPVLRQSPGYEPRAWGRDAAVLALACFPAMGQLAGIAERRHAWNMFIDVASPVELVTVFPLGVWIGVPLIAWALDARLRHAAVARGVPPPATALLAGIAWIAVPLVAAWIATATDVGRLFFARYLLAAAAGGMVTGAVVFDHCRTALMRTACAAALAAWCLAALAPQFGRHVNPLPGEARTPLSGEDWRGAVAYLDRAYAERPRPVFVRSGFIEADALRDAHPPGLHDFCLLPVRSLYPLKVPEENLIPLPTTNTGRLAPADARRLAEAGGAWLVLRGDPPIAEVVVDQLKAVMARRNRTVRVKREQPFAGVSVVEIELTANE
jgi:mannosyltransferase